MLEGDDGIGPVMVESGLNDCDGGVEARAANQASAASLPWFDADLQYDACLHTG